MGGFAHLYRAGGRNRAVLLVKVQAGIFPGQFQVVDQSAGIGFQVTGRVFITDIEKSPREALAPYLHQSQVAGVVPRHLLLVVRVQIRVRE
jgi:hypothetical protein